MFDVSTDSGISSASVLGGLVGGLAHAAVAVVLWNRWFDDLWELLATKPLNGAYLLLGMFLLGFVPVALYVAEDVVTPAIVVGVCFLLTGLGSWLAGPVQAPSAVPTPFALYVLLWVGVVALAGVAGGVEHRQRRRATG